MNDALTVLVGEDDLDILTLLARRLERRGFQVITATTGDDALAAAIEHRPDAAVLDGLMPGLEGHQVCARMRIREDTAKIPVILLTAKASDVDRNEAIEAGVDEYVLKPFSIDELDEKIRKLIAARAR